MSRSDLKVALSSATRDELNVLARQHNVVGYRGMRKPELIDALAGCGAVPRPKGETSGWWSRYHNHVYGAATIVSLVLAVAVFLPDFESQAPSSETVVGRESGSQDSAQLRDTSPLPPQSEYVKRYLKRPLAEEISIEIQKVTNVSVDVRVSWLTHWESLTGMYRAGIQVRQVKKGNQKLAQDWKSARILEAPELEDNKLFNLVAGNTAIVGGASARRDIRFTNRRLELRFG